MDYINFFARSNTRIARLNVSVNKFFSTHLLESLGQLNSNVQNGLERKFVLAKLKELFKVGAHHCHG
jgi:hypothetical protein